MLLSATTAYLQRILCTRKEYHPSPRLHFISRHCNTLTMKGEMGEQLVCLSWLYPSKDPDTSGIEPSYELHPLNSWM